MAMKTNVNFQNQKGLTLITMILLLGVIGFFVLLILKIGPIYLDHGKVVDALAAVKSAPDFDEMSEHDIKDIISKRFDLNYVKDVTPKDIVIQKSGAYTKVSIDYEVIVKIFGNLSVLVEFSDAVEAGVE
ncbi:hypothetical protein JCM14076_01110 [Methylosoma difficile]